MQRQHRTDVNLVGSFIGSLVRSPIYTDQDLRNRSFKGRSLNGADFSGADLRGCDFSNAKLVGANFTAVRTGQTRRQRGVWLGVAIVTFLVVGHAVSTLVFSSLGQAPGDKAWTYVIVLTISLAIAGAASGLRSWLKSHITSHIAQSVSGAASGAVAGFFYAGILAGKDPRWAIVGAVAGGLLVAIVGWRWRIATVAIVVNMAGAIAAYGFAFLVGATALSMLNVSYFTPGLLLGLLSLLYLWFTLNSLTLLVQCLRHAPGTLFRRANLTDASFSAAELPQADFRGAIGENTPISSAYPQV